MKRIINCDVETFNKHLSYAKRNLVLINRERNKGDANYVANITVNKVICRLTYKKYKMGLTTFVCRLDGTVSQDNLGQVAYRTLVSYFNKYNHQKNHEASIDIRDKKEFGYKEIYQTVNTGKPNEYLEKRTQWNRDIGSAKAELYFNENYNKKRISNCIGYDINSSYTAAMLNPMPDTSVKPKRNSKVGNNELGFKTFNGCMTMVKNGYADYVFPAMDSPFERFARNWYIKKKNAKTPEAKSKAKHMLNDAVGYLQIVNPFMRAAIMTYANKKITKIIENHFCEILHSNTDSIVATERIPEIEDQIGTELGQWKIEHEGDFAYIGHTYQWNMEKPKWRGIPKTAIPEKFDLLTDYKEKFEFVNPYYYDKKTKKIIKR